MKKIYRPFIKGTNWALVGIASLLGFTSCGDIVPPVAEYGTPSADYAIKGKVVNEKGTAIPGLQIELQKENEYGMPDILYSQNDGTFAWERRVFPAGEIEIITTDVDGEANGSYAADTTNVNFKGANFNGGNGHWYNGKAEKEVTITLKEK
jgi:putative lipoprotein (rSAM/lipoprotein system)